MLLNVNNNKKITYIPHQREYEAWINRLLPTELEAIKAEILKRIDKDEIATAGWIPGSNWSGTPFHAIYEKACFFDEEAAGKCFGLIVWATMMEHEDCWAFGRYELNNLPIQSMTYFKVSSCE